MANPLLQERIRHLHSTQALPALMTLLVLVMNSTNHPSQERQAIRMMPVRKRADTHKTCYKILLLRRSPLFVATFEYRRESLSTTPSIRTSSCRFCRVRDREGDFHAHNLRGFFLMSSYERIEPTKSGKSFLRESSMLTKLDESSFEMIYKQLEWIRLPPNTTLFQQGTQGNELYILVSGRLGAVREAEDGASELIGEIKPGESIGEMSVLTEETRTATIIAFRDSILVTLSKQNFRKLIETHPDTLLMMNQVLIERLQNNITGSSESQTVTKIFSVIPISEQLPTSHFCKRLEQELSHWGRVLRLSSVNIGQQTGISLGNFDDETVSKIVFWLHEQEQHYDFLIMEADHNETAWTKFCVHHGDRLLLLANATRSPQGDLGRPYTKQRPGISRRRELVLVHPDSTRTPSGTRFWLDTYPVDSHYHIRLGSKPDLKRLVRYLTGRSIALSLAGGGALGMAHIGVLRALREYDVPIDLACGVSAGATIAAQQVCGWSHQQIAQQTKAAFPKNLFMDINVPIVSMLRTRMLRAGFQQIFGERRIEDLWSKYYCSSSNLTQARIKLLDQGLLWDRLMASGALPGFYPPYTDEHGDLLVDGAILDNLPALHTEKYCQGKKIAVNVIPTLDMNICNGLPANQSSIGMLLNAVNPFKTESFPNIFHIALRSVFLHGVFDAEKIKQSVDLYIEPPLEQFSFLSMGAFDSIVKLGYHAARPAIESWIAGDPEVRRIISINQA